MIDASSVPERVYDFPAGLLNRANAGMRIEKHGGSLYERYEDGRLFAIPDWYTHGVLSRWVYEQDSVTDDDIASAVNVGWL